MSAHRDMHLELCAGYALGSLDELDRRALEAHLAEGCAICDQELAALTEAASMLAAAAPPQKAPKRLRRRVRDRVRAEAGLRTPVARPARPAQPWIPTWAWAMAAILLAVGTFIEWRATTRLERELVAAHEERATLARQLEEEKRWSALPSAPQARVVELAPTPEGSPLLVARITYDPSSRTALVVADHFDAPAGKDYELWAITASGPASLGLVRAGHSGRVVVRLGDIGDPSTISAFAVSLENEGGAPTHTAPAGPVVMLGKVGG